MIYIAFEKCKNTPASQHEAGVSARNKLFSHFGIRAEVKKTENGKPYIDDQSIHFSVSHSECFAVCALRCKTENYDLPDDIFTLFEDGEGDIGVDLQKLPDEERLDRLNKIALRYFGKAFETAFDFTLEWTKKEAFCKYMGSSLADAFKEDDSAREFFSGVVELNNEKYVMAICY